MRSPRAVFGLALCAACLLASDTLAQKSYDYRRYNFSAIKTYAFKDDRAPATIEDRTTTYGGPLMEERTRVAIAAELDRRGWKRDDANPDVYVVTRRTFKKEYSYLGGFGWGYPGPYSWYGYGYGRYPYYWNSAPLWWDAPTVYEEVRGTLTIDIEDVESGAVI